MSKTDEMPSRTYDCLDCQITYFAGPKAGYGPFMCDECHEALTLRPEGAEPYDVRCYTAVSVCEPKLLTLPLFAEPAP